jgi:ComF family protein
MLHRCRTCGLALTSYAMADPRCGACLREQPPLDACYVGVDYAYPWAGLIHQFKFEAHLGLAFTLSRLLTHQTLVHEGLSRTPAWLMPMPLSTERLRERGFNQAQLLAQALANQMGCEGLRVYSDGLWRIRDIAPQHELPLTKRLHNVRHSVLVNPAYLAQVRGQNVWLVDDVMTTGASVFEAARVLREAGAAQVGALVVARTPLR